MINVRDIDVKLAPENILKPIVRIIDYGANFIKVTSLIRGHNYLGNVKSKVLYRLMQSDRVVKDWQESDIFDYVLPNQQYFIDAKYVIIDQED